MQVDAEEHVRAHYSAADPSPRERQLANHVFTLPSDCPLELAPFDACSSGGGDSGSALVDTLPRKAQLERLANGTRAAVSASCPLSPLLLLFLRIFCSGLKVVVRGPCEWCLHPCMRPCPLICMHPMIPSMMPSEHCSSTD